MAKAHEVVEMLIPNGGWIMNGREYEDIVFVECDPITKAEFEAGFAQFDAIQLAKEQKAAADKLAAEAKLVAIGLTLNDLKALNI